MVRLSLGSLEDLALEESRVLPVAGGRPPRMSVLVVRVDDGVRAYWNLCRHLPVPLDSGVGRLPPGDLVCLTHGARYRATDGLCVAGPCKGARLEPVAVHRDGDAYYLEL